MTTTDYLDSLLADSIPGDYERHLASVHRTQSGSWLKQKLQIVGIFEAGSWTHGTAVKGFSDVDYFAVLSNRTLSASGSLAALRLNLGQAFSRATVTVNNPAVRIDFGRGPSIEVTTAISSGTRFNIPRYEGDGWIPSNPVKHAEYVNLTRGKHPLHRLGQAVEIAQKAHYANRYNGNATIFLRTLFRN